MKKILLAVDPDGLAESVLPMVATLARALGAEVVALHVTEETESDARWWNATDVLNDVVVRLAREGIRAVAEAREGGVHDVADQIAATAAEVNADLIALGSHGRGDLGALFLGSIGHRVAQLTSIPVLVARPTPAAEKAGTLKRVLVAVDRSPESGPAIDLAGQIARQAHAEVRLVHALENAVVEGAAYFEPADEAGAYLAEQAGRLDGKGITVTTAVVDGWGGVAARITDAAVAWDADLVVLGSRRLGEIGGIVQASTSHAVVAQADRPVMLAARPPRKA